jgi:hypothetical protein
MIHSFRIYDLIILNLIIYFLIILIYQLLQT